MLFKVTKNDIFQDNPELSMLGDLVNLTDRQMKYICFVYDYESPFRKLPLDERKERAADLVGYKYEKGGKRFDVNARNLLNGKVAGVEKAIPFFLSLQKDSDAALLNAVESQIQQIVAFAVQPDKKSADIEKGIKFVKELPALRKTLNELKAIVEPIDDDNKLTSEGEEEVKVLSTLDKLNIKRTEQND